MELLFLKILFIDIIGGGSGRLFELLAGLQLDMFFFHWLIISFCKLSFSTIYIRRNELIAFILGTFLFLLGWLQWQQMILVWQWQI